MKKVDKKTILFFLTLLLSSNSMAGLLRLESDTLGSLRKSDSQTDELPLYEYLSASYTADSQNLELNSNFSFFTDPMNQNNQFDLYILDVSYRLLPDFMSIRFGRSFNTHTTIRTSTTDSANVEFSLFDTQLKLGSFAGMEREFAIGGFKDAAVIFGVYGTYRTSSALPYLLSLKYQLRDYQTNTNPNEHLGQVAMQKALPLLWDPEFLINSEFKLNTSHLNQLETGVDLYPTPNTSLRGRLLTYETTSTDDIETPLFTIFSLGRLYEGRTELEYRFNKFFSTSFAVAVDNYVLQENLRTTGYLFELGTHYHPEIFTLANSIYIFKSYGGSVLGDRVSVTHPLSDLIKLKGGAEVTYYEKVTSSKRFAFSTEAGAIFHMIKQVDLYMGGEFRRNNIYQQDTRAIAKLTYSLWVES